MAKEKTPTADERIQKLFDKVQIKKAEIAKAERPNWLTNCTFGYDENLVVNRMNLHTVSDVDKIVKATAFLMLNADAHERACKELGVESKFEWMGYPVSSWIEDFKTRITKIKIADKKKELDTYETNLNKLISPERRKEMEIEAMEKALGD